jgi:hypothetical protein
MTAFMPASQVRRFVAVAVVAAPLLILGSAVRTQAPASPCAVVTVAEVEQVIGKIKGSPSPQKEGGASWCNYEFTSGKDAFEVWMLPADGLERRRPKAKSPVAVKGLGEDAFMERGAFGLDYVDLYIRKGKSTVKLSLKQGAGDESKLRTLGQNAAGRL